MIGKIVTKKSNEISLIVWALAVIFFVYSVLNEMIKNGIIFS